MVQAATYLPKPRPLPPIAMPLAVLSFDAGAIGPEAVGLDFVVDFFVVLLIIDFLEIAILVSLRIGFEFLLHRLKSTRHAKNSDLQKLFS